LYISLEPYNVKYYISKLWICRCKYCPFTFFYVQPYDGYL